MTSRQHPGADGAAPGSFAVPRRRGRVSTAFAPSPVQTGLERPCIVLFLLASIAYGAVTALLASQKPLWNDELYTYYIAALPSMQDVWGALKTGGEQLPLLFYAVTRLAFAVFGPGELAARLPAIAGFWLMSACLLVFVARRAVWPGALVAAIFPFVTTTHAYSYEARPYGLVLGFAGLALVTWQSATLDHRRRASLVLLGLSLAAAVSSHYYAILLILPLALGEAIRTLDRRGVDVPVWLALFVAPVAALLAHLPLLRAGAAYSGAFWATPQWADVRHTYDYLLATAVFPVTVILVITATCALAGARPAEAGTVGAASSRGRPERFELAAALGFVLLPVAAVLLAKLVTGAFTFRYVLPTVIGFAVLAGFGADLAFARLSALRLVTVAVLVGWFLAYHARELHRPDPPRAGSLASSLYRHASGVPSAIEAASPIVIAEPQMFTELWHHGAPELRTRLVYLADTKLALEHLGHDGVERGMLDLVEPWFGMNVEPFEPAFASRSRLLVFGGLGGMNWVLPELRARGARVELLAQEGDQGLWLATRPDRPAPSQ